MIIRKQKFIIDGHNVISYRFEFPSLATEIDSDPHEHLEFSDSIKKDDIEDNMIMADDISRIMKMIFLAGKRNEELIVEETITG